MKFPFIISIPHCSFKIPEEVLPTLALTNKEIWESTDIGTEEIFGPLPAKVSLCARWSRLVVDLNRSHDQRDRKGVIAQVDYHGRPVFREGCIPDEKVVERRLRKYYWPFHNRLTKAIENPDIKVLFDCHSLNGIGPEEAPDAGKKRKDIILSNNGDQSGKADPGRGRITCPIERLYLMKEAFQEAGFSVSINDPYAGGFITIHYGQKYARMGKISVQIEINQDLYLEPNSVQPIAERLGKVRGKVLQAFRKIASKF
jgi:N-formylglutamate amidohydrolase